jgi:hypothetical protein
MLELRQPISKEICFVGEWNRIFEALFDFKKIDNLGA